jgi:hypothetical protein
MGFSSQSMGNLLKREMLSIEELRAKAVVRWRALRR